MEKNNEYFYLDSENKTAKVSEVKLLSESKSKKLYDYLLKKLPWEFGKYNMFGREVKTPRLLWAMKDDNFDIEKSYKTSGSSIWSKKMLKIKTKVENIINKKIKYAQINYYRDGNDYIGWHTDSEVIDGDVIASLSLGVTRKFQFQKINTKAIHNMNLESGTLIIFDHIAAKKEWKHRVPKQPKINDGRINITFRLR